MRVNFRLQRLYFDLEMFEGQKLELDREKTNYLANVLRLSDGAEILVFNGKNGEWLAHLKFENRKKAHLELTKQVRPQPEIPTLTVLFAPIKVGRLEYMVQKITEMGAGVIQPILTDHTQLHKVNQKRLSANIIEAAEQCGVLSVPQLKEPIKLAALLEDWDENRHIVFCDEGTETKNPVSEIETLKGHEIALMVGPEGGFSEDERERLNNLEYIHAISLGPRILRADTAIVAAMAVIQAISGDWK